MLGRFLASFVRDGRLTVIWPDGRMNVYGEGTPEAAVRLHGRLTPLRIRIQPELALGEAYMDGRLTIERGTIADVLEILIFNYHRHRRDALLYQLRRFTRMLGRRLSQLNRVTRARRNVAHHYDLSGELYDLFLDADRQYSCAYFADPKMTLEEAQAAKKRHIAAKLRLDRAGLKVLDIGSGWGGLALDLARQAEARVLGITLSTEQLATADSRASAAGLSQRCSFALRDYRQVEGQFDRIVSVGMFEHVGIGYYDAFFGKVRELLAPDGVALLHTIGREDGPHATNPWIKKYIFPGGYTPALSEVMRAIERCGLHATDIEILRLHYAETLKEWRRRFNRNRAKAAAIYDERFCRMWEFYLASSEMTFRYGNQVVYQIQLAKRFDAVPIRRDYMFDAERAMRSRGGQSGRRKPEAA
jgi:cyclopropane-fatty-acyl-phospholipid synthase